MSSSNRPLTHPSKSIPNHNPSTLVNFHAVWQEVRLITNEEEARSIHDTDMPDMNTDSTVLNDGLLMPSPSSCLDILSQI